MLGRELLMVELYPWHSRTVKGLIKPPSSVLDEFVWAPLGELEVDTVFAFGRPWVAGANALGLAEQARWGATAFTSPVREAVAYRLPGGQQRLVVVWQSAYAGPPGPADTDRLHELLGE